MATATTTHHRPSPAPEATEPRPKARGLLTPGNTKLGFGLIFAWSLPARLSCPGATAACILLCYALRGRYRTGSIRDRLVAMFALSKKATFVAAMARAIAHAFARVVRVHVAGDFYDAEYVRKWVAIAQARPATVFYAYTRSWRVPAMLPALAELAALPNFHLWLSEDRDTGASPAIPGTRVAFLVATAGDEALVPAYADLVFRDHSHEKLRPGQVKAINGVRVCPFEQAASFRGCVTCSTCRICFTRKPSKRDAAVTAEAV